ncbi:N-acetylmuramoyl-L-alanine amidase [Candidatus Pelagibacter sp.]|nr:N-acetylmuramoyl-L-alanine amidase [Candidatus Pelagibacter sp.]
MWPKISLNYSPNFNTIKRLKKNIRFIIVHYTGMQNESSALNRLCDIKTKVSAHYFIKKNGSVLNLVPPIYEAWHAGKSSWKDLKSLNKYSIGIEIQNSGHDNKYEKFSQKQIISTKKLLRYLINKYKVNLKNILGHSDISPDRKKDPGEKFPWKDLAKSKLSRWHNLDEKNLKRERLILLNAVEEDNLMMNLNKIGYFKISRKKDNSKKRIIIKAFQRHFRQKLINGIPDKECLIISKNLLKSK